MKIIHVLLMLALIAGGYFIRDVVEPTKEAQAGIDGLTKFQLVTNEVFVDSVRFIMAVAIRKCDVHTYDDRLGHIKCPPGFFNFR